jgi:hypothetical protein
VFSDADPHLAGGIVGIDRMYACATSDQDQHSDRYCTSEIYFLAVILALHFLRTKIHEYTCSLYWQSSPLYHAGIAV